MLIKNNNILLIKKYYQEFECNAITNTHMKGLEVNRKGHFFSSNASKGSMFLFHSIALRMWSYLPCISFQIFARLSERERERGVCDPTLFNEVDY
jgi:hypothetical protein